MIERRTSFLLTALLVGTTAGGSYVMAQAKPTPADPVSAQPVQANASCDHAAGHKHDGMKGKTDMNMHNGDSCPMMDPPAMTVEVEKTGHGAVLRLSAKSATDIVKVQELALEMSKHLQDGCKMMTSTKMGGSTRNASDKPDAPVMHH